MIITPGGVAHRTNREPHHSSLWPKHTTCPVCLDRDSCGQSQTTTQRSQQRWRGCGTCARRWRGWTAMTRTAVTSGGVGASLAAAAAAHDPPPLLPTPRRRFQSQATTVYWGRRSPHVKFRCGLSPQHYRWWRGAAAQLRPAVGSALAAAAAVTAARVARRWCPGLAATAAVNCGGLFLNFNLL